MLRKFIPFALGAFWLALTASVGYSVTSGQVALLAYSGAHSYQTPTCTNGASNSPNSSLTATFASAQTAGDLNVVAIGWNSSAGSITSVHDTEGNTYSVASALVTASGAASQAIYYAPNIVSAAGGANTVTVALSGAGTSYDVRILECSGLATASPFDVQNGAASTTGTAINSGAVNTRQSTELLVGAAYVFGSAPTPTSGFATAVTSAQGNTIQIQAVTATGSYNSTATQPSSGFWAMNLATFKAAGGGGSSSSSSGSGSSSSGSSASSSSSSSGGSQTLLAYLNSLRASGKMASGQHFNQFSANGLDQFLPSGSATPANATILQCNAGSGGNCTSSSNSGLTPAVLGIYMNTPGTCPSGPSTANAISIANGWISAGGIVLISVLETDPSQSSGCGFSGSNNAFPGVITVGNAYYQTFMFGASGCTSYTGTSPCNGGIGAQVAAINQINATGAKLIIRPLWENNLTHSSWWWGTGSGSNPTNAQYVALWKQVVTYMRANGVNALYIYVLNSGGGSNAANDPGAYNASTNPGGRDLAGVDMYFPTTQAGVISNLTDPSQAGVYVQGLGIPWFLAEVGVENCCAQPTLFGYDNSIWDEALQSTDSNLVGSLPYTQNWCLGCQLNGGTYLLHTVPRQSLPPLLNKLIKPPVPIWAANDDAFDAKRRA